MSLPTPLNAGARPRLQGQPNCSWAAQGKVIPGSRPACGLPLLVGLDVPAHLAAGLAPAVGCCSWYQEVLCNNRWGLAQTFMVEKQYARVAEAVEQLAGVV